MVTTLLALALLALWLLDAAGYAIVGTLLPVLLIAAAVLLVWMVVSSRGILAAR
jgi:hypothetical protein